MKYLFYYFFITVLVLSPSFSVAQEGQLSTTFQRRFGPDSALFNNPLYFSTRQMVNQKKAKPRKRNYRDEIRRKIASSFRKKATKGNT